MAAAVACSSGVRKWLLGCVFALVLLVNTVCAVKPPAGLFIFGDSYVDIGNRNRTSADWETPYGETWPGHPAGRYSNGRNIGDWLPDMLGLPQEPPPYRQLYNQPGDPPLGNFSTRYGINFAVGGSGVFKDFGWTTFDQQISQLEALLNSSVYTKEFLAESFVFISTANNDYLYAIDFKTAQPILHLPTYIQSVVNALAAGIRRLYALGARTIITTNLMPIGCLPIARTYLSTGNTCSILGNDVATAHNQALYRVLPSLRAQPGSRIVIADIHKAYLEIFTIQNNWAGVKFANTTRACCNPDGGGILCGTSKTVGDIITIDAYTVCSNPQDHFFWDTVHLTDMGFHTLVHLWAFGGTYVNPYPNLRALLPS